MSNDDKKIIRKKIDGYALEITGHVMITLRLYSKIKLKINTNTIALCGIVLMNHTVVCRYWENFDNKLNIAGFEIILHFY